MASQYLGTTAASSVTNPPILMWSPIGGGKGPNVGQKFWSYQSTNSTTEVTTAGFFTDGQTLGMAIGDTVFGGYCTSAGSASYPYMGMITAASSTGCTLGTATT